MKRSAIDLNFTASPLLHAIDLAKELKSKNIRKVKNKELSSQGIESVHLADGSLSDTQLVIDDSRSLGGTNRASLVDWASWLPFASKHYNISPNVEDYIAIAIPTIVTDLANRNGVAFPLKELVQFRPNLGMQSYKTWKGKPTFEEHSNEDHTKAKGVILDTHLRAIPKMGTWRLMKLLAFDRTRDPQLCKDILENRRNSYSMGAYVDGYTCSICHKDWGMCNHVPAGLGKRDVAFLPVGNKLLFKNVVNPEGFETSSVKTPAFISAINDNVMNLGDLLDTSDSTPSNVIQLANLDGILNFKQRRGK